MQDKQYDMLMKAANEHAYMSIAINSDGTPSRGAFIPWERTVSAFNMKKPIVTLAVDDLQDKDIMNALKKCALEGCYIYTALADYSFIADFIELKDLYILHGEHMSDLSFIRHLSKLFMFYLEGATLPDLNPLIDNCNENKVLLGRCLGFYNCTVVDTSALAKIKFMLSELLVWPAKGDSIGRWRPSDYFTIFRFYKN